MASRTVALRAIGYLWSSPYGLVGLAAAGLMATLGWLQASAWRGGALHLVVQGPLAERMRARGWAGTTIGWAIFFWRVPNASLAHHEERHVGQVLLLGVFFLPVYAVIFLALLFRALGTTLIAGAWRRNYLADVFLGACERAYHDHPLERDARKAAAAKVLGGPPRPLLPRR